MIAEKPVLPYKEIKLLIKNFKIFSKFFAILYMLNFSVYHSSEFLSIMIMYVPSEFSHVFAVALM